MAYKQFFEGKQVLAFDSNETNELGQFQPRNNGELGHIMCDLFVHGTPGGTERMRVHIASVDDVDNPYASSDWVDVADFDDSDGSNDWLGWVRFDFNRENIDNDLTYYIWLEADNYTRNGDTFYLGVCWDFPSPTYAADDDPSSSTWGFRWFSWV